MPDFVRVTNDDTRPFIYHWNNEKKVIPPGRDMMMPWSLACSLFGDPFLADRPKKPDRTDALRRARGNFNYELGIETMETFMARIPQLRMFDMETGQQMFMLLYDPEGQMHANYKAPDYEASDPVSLLTAQVQNLTMQLQTLLASQAGAVPNPLQGNNLPMVTTDAGPVQNSDAPQPQNPGAQWIGGNAFAQRPEDMGPPLFDFGAASTAPVEGPLGDGAPIDFTNAIPEDLIAQASAPTDGIPADLPTDVGVPSVDAPTPKLAKRKP